MLNKDHTVSFPTAATCTVNESVAAPRKSVMVFVKYTPVTCSLPLTYYRHYTAYASAFFFQMTVETPSRSASFHTQLDASLTQVGRALAGGNLQAIAKAVFTSDGLRKQFLQKFTDALNNEVTELCKKRANPLSLFRRISIEKVSDFRWCDCIAN